MGEGRGGEEGGEGGKKEGEESGGGREGWERGGEGGRGKEEGEESGGGREGWERGGGGRRVLGFEGGDCWKVEGQAAMLSGAPLPLSAGDVCPSGRPAQCHLPEGIGGR